jgi:DNA-binding XRE family transcriptional regulator
MPDVPARHDPNAKPETKLARVRMARGVTQDELAEAIGISVPTYRRLELGVVENLGLRYLVTAALALSVELDEVLEDEWLAWKTFDQSRPWGHPSRAGSGAGRSGRGSRRSTHSCAAGPSAGFRAARLIKRVRRLPC